jgi:hypothetical protein
MRASTDEENRAYLSLEKNVINAIVNSNRNIVFKRHIGCVKLIMLNHRSSVVIHTIVETQHDDTLKMCYKIATYFVILFNTLLLRTKCITYIKFHVILQASFLQRINIILQKYTFISILKTKTCL